MSSVWRYFYVSPMDETKAICKLCSAILTRGGANTKSYGTSSMIKHLRMKHSCEHILPPKEKKRKVDTVKFGERPCPKLKEVGPGSNSPSAANITELHDIGAGCSNVAGPSHRLLPEVATSTTAVEPWNASDTRATDLHHRIAQMIAIDGLDLATVEKCGFVDFMRSLEPRYTMPDKVYFATSVVPSLHDKCCTRIRALIDSARTVLSAITLTTDMRGCKCHDSKSSFQVFSGRWITENFDRIHVVLHASYFNDKETSNAISDALNEILRFWKLKTEDIHLILWDSNPEVTAGEPISQVKHQSCFVHNFLLALHYSVFSHETFLELVSKCSGVAVQLPCLDNYKNRYDIKFRCHKSVLNDIATSLNSTYALLKCISEQKQCSRTLSCEDHILIHDFTLIMEQIFILVKELSSEHALMSMVIPSLAAFERFIGKMTSNNLREEIIQSLNYKFKQLYIEKTYVMSTLLDPRYKLSFVKSGIHKTIKANILQKMQNLCFCKSDTNVGKDIQSTPSVWSCLTEIIEETAKKPTDKPSITEEEQELESYLKRPNIAHTENPLTWWKDNCKAYPHLAVLARRYLSTPASNINNEKVFNNSGIMNDKDKGVTQPLYEEMLLLLHFNLPLLDNICGYRSCK